LRSSLLRRDDRSPRCCATITQLLAAGVHPKAVSERLGHTTVGFTLDVHSAVIPSMGRAAADPPMPPISCSAREEGETFAVKGQLLLDSLRLRPHHPTADVE
jgi:hypothetical protein